MIFCRTALQPLLPIPVSFDGIVVTQVQDLAFGLVETHTVGLGSSVQPDQIPLQSLPSLEKVDSPPQLGVICKLTEGTLNALIQIINKDIKQDRIQN